MVPYPGLLTAHTLICLLQGNQNQKHSPNAASQIVQCKASAKSKNSPSFILNELAILAQQGNIVIAKKKKKTHLS